MQAYSCSQLYSCWDWPRSLSIKGGRCFQNPRVRLAAFHGSAVGSNTKKAVIESSERQFLQFHRQAPAAFWLSVMLNLASHVLAITEVYLILLFLGAHASFVSALILESLTKLINVIGAVNPGNLGTYEGGNMVIGKLVGLNGAQGLTLGLCRRARAIFWAIVGAICLAWYSRLNGLVKPDGNAEIVTGVDLCR